MKETKKTSLRTNASLDRRKIQGSFTGGDVSSDGGLMALRAAGLPVEGVKKVAV